MLNKDKLSTIVFDYMRINGVAPTKFCAERIINDLCVAIQTALAKGQEVNIPEIGRFHVQYYKGGKYKTLQGQSGEFEGRNKVKFKTSAQLKKLIN